MGRDVTTIQATAKIWKAVQALGILIFVAGFGVWFALDLPEAGVWTLVAGLGVIAVGGVLAWWFHG